MGFINCCPSGPLYVWNVDDMWIFSHEVGDNLVAQVEVHSHPYTDNRMKAIRTATKIPLCIPFLGIARPQSQFPCTFMCL